MSKPDCIGINICLHPSFQEWYDEECPQRSAQCGSYALHGLGLRKVCGHPDGPKLGLRTITLQELYDLRSSYDDTIHYLSNKADDTIREYEEKNEKTDV